MKVNKLMLIILSTMFLVACQTRTEYRDVKVPVYMVPEPPEIEKPELPIHNIEISVSDIINKNKAGEKIGKLSQAYVISVRLLMNWGQANERIVKTYREMSQKDFSVDPISFSNNVNARMAVSEEKALNQSNSNNDILLEPRKDDFATLEIYANQKFNDIIDKYNAENQKIVQEFDETISTEDE